MASPARVYRESTEIEGQTGITKKHGSQQRALSVCLIYVCTCVCVCAVFPTEPRERLGDRDWPGAAVRRGRRRGGGGGGEEEEENKRRRRGEEDEEEIETVRFDMSTGLTVNVPHVAIQYNAMQCNTMHLHTAGLRQSHTKRERGLAPRLQ